jgi:hypothetical protein
MVPTRLLILHIEKHVLTDGRRVVYWTALMLLQQELPFEAGSNISLK